VAGQAAEEASWRLVRARGAARGPRPRGARNRGALGAPGGLSSARHALERDGPPPDSAGGGLLRLSRSRLEVTYSRPSQRRTSTGTAFLHVARRSGRATRRTTASGYSARGPGRAGSVDRPHKRTGSRPESGWVYSGCVGGYAMVGVTQPERSGGWGIAMPSSSCPVAAASPLLGSRVAACDLVSSPR
jgi:hypothetical protein